jgi:hypothetical protein
MKLKNNIKKEPKCFYYIQKNTKLIYIQYRKIKLNKIYILNYKFRTKENKR